MTSDPPGTLRFDAALDDMKLVYRVLHQNLHQHLELMDCEFLDDLQRRLQASAREDGVDITDHGAWDRWLGNVDAPSCEERFAGRPSDRDRD